jgi:hypothetical protein
LRVSEPVPSRSGGTSHLMGFSVGV